MLVVPRIAWLAVGKAKRSPEGELGQVELADEDAPRLSKPRHHGGVLGRHVAAEEGRARGGEDARGVELILHREGNAMQRPAPLALRRLALGPLRLHPRAVLAHGYEGA
jgi:hypothetical protein